MVERMKVIERANIPDGTEIWLEDWSDKNTEQFPDLYGLQIGAYPIAKTLENMDGYGAAKSSVFQSHRTNIRVVPTMMYERILKP